MNSVAETQVVTCQSNNLLSQQDDHQRVPTLLHFTIFSWKTMIPLKFIVLFLLPLIPARGDTSTESKVHLRNGEVHGGSAISSRDGKPYHFFKGIPYGKVEKRFGVKQNTKTNCIFKLSKFMG